MQTPREERVADSLEKDVVNVLQISDCHLTKSAAGELLGVNTLDSLDAVLDEIAKDALSPDVVLVTGDLSQDGSVEAYQTLKQRLQVFACPQYWFAGNHDSRRVMEQVVNGGPELAKVADAGAWQIILLDSLLEGKVHGELSSSELAHLERCLADQGNDARPTLVSLHHHPVEINSRWLDNIGLHNRDEFWQIIDRYPQVQGVLWGHIHQEFQSKRGAIELLASPSTCIQFLPLSSEFAVDEIAPGYRWLQLHADGNIDSKVVRAESFEFQVDMASNGY